MAQPDPAPPAAAEPLPSVVVKKYANRRLYNTETSSYITLDNLADMIRAGRNFVVYDAKSGDDITRGVLTQIIVEEESKGSSMLPTAFLRQLIGFYGGSLQGVVPSYLEQALATFARQQAQVRQAVQQTISPFLPPGIEEMSRQNVAMIERAMGLFNPFALSREAAPAQADVVPDASPSQARDSAHDAVGPLQADATSAELERLRCEVESLRSQLAAARADAAPVQAVGDAPAIPAHDNDFAAKSRPRGARRAR